MGMFLFLLVVLMSWVVSVVAFKYANKPGDDFGRAGVAVSAFLLAFILTGIYLGIALWTHRFW